jgi:energy-coupling factor transporter ATP-binding protein EcfA2
LAGLDIIIWPDRDVPGENQAKAKAQMMHDSKEPRIIRMITPPPELPEGGDIIDAVRCLGWRKPEIDRLISNAADFIPEGIATRASEVQESGREDQVVTANLTLPDMSEAVLVGRLGDLTQKLLRLSPLAYAWPAVVSVAGTLAHQGSKLRTNLFVSLVGPKGSGKSTTTDNAIGLMGLPKESPEMVRCMAGSAEGLFRAIGDAGGCARLYAPDELDHLFSKIQIDHASFAPVLQRAFYETSFQLVIAKGQKIDFNASLGILGGIVEEKFEECFGAITTAGLHDRFIFGICPQPFNFNFQPFEDGSESLPSPVAVGVHSEVWTQIKEWVRTVPGMTGRIAENALRVASICAGFDGRSLLLVQDPGPALEFAKYQIRARALLQPNPGQNADARCAFAILQKLEQLAPNGGQVASRIISKAIHSERFGPGIFRYAIQNLAFSGEIEATPSSQDKRVLFLRRTS